MKIRLNIVLSVFALFLITSCTKEVTTGNVSRVTNFANLTMMGDQTYKIPCGSSFSDPGVTAEENGTPVDVTSTINGGKYFGESSINTDVQDLYSIDYSAVNSDGFPGSTSRKVLVACNGDFVDDFSGAYTSTVVRSGSAGAAYTNMGFIFINKSGNKYTMTDGIGGYYDIGRDYGTNYIASGVEFTVASNTATFLNGDLGVGDFGGVLTMQEMTFDPATKTVHFISNWDAGYVFDVTLTQVKL